VPSDESKVEDMLLTLFNKVGWDVLSNVKAGIFDGVWENFDHVQIRLTHEFANSNLAAAIRDGVNDIMRAYSGT